MRPVKMGVRCAVWVGVMALSGCQKELVIETGCEVPEWEVMEKANLVMLGRVVGRGKALRSDVGNAPLVVYPRMEVHRVYQGTFKETNVRVWDVRGQTPRDVGTYGLVFGRVNGAEAVTVHRVIPVEPMCAEKWHKESGSVAIALAGTLLFCIAPGGETKAYSFGALAKGVGGVDVVADLLMGYLEKAKGLDERVADCLAAEDAVFGSTGCSERLLGEASLSPSQRKQLEMKVEGHRRVVRGCERWSVEQFMDIVLGGFYWPRQYEISVLRAAAKYGNACLRRQGCEALRRLEADYVLCERAE